MQLVKDNPFRILGLTGNCSEREIQKQLGTLKAYARVGKIKTFATDIKSFAPPARGLEEIQQAVNKIEKYDKRLYYGLFWISNKTAIDEIAINHLNLNYWKAYEIWEKACKNEINSKNWNAYLNLSTLALATYNENTSEPGQLKNAVKIKGDLIFSEFLENETNVPDEVDKLNKKESIAKFFVDDLFEILIKRKGFNPKDFIELFGSYPERIKKYTQSKFIDVRVAEIERNIENTKVAREQSPDKANELGEGLFLMSKSNLEFITDILGKKNVQTNILNNKLAGEIMQCSISYYNALNNDKQQFVLALEAMRILMIAKDLNVNGQIVDKIKKNEEALDRILYNDLYGVIDVLKQITSAIKDMVIQNRDKPIFEWREIDETKVNNFLRTEVTKDRIVNISKSKPDLIKEFYDLLKYLKKKLIFSVEVDRVLKTLGESLPNDHQIALGIITGFESNKHRSVNNNSSEKNENKTQLTKEIKNCSNSNKKEKSSLINAFTVIILVVVAIVIITRVQNAENKLVSNPDVPPTSIVEQKLKDNRKYRGNTLKTGDSPYDILFGLGRYNYSHQNKVIFKNSNHADAVVCLVKYDQEITVRNEYIKAGRTFTMTNVPNGLYYMKVYSGTNWNPGKTIIDGKSVGGFESMESFYESKTGNGLIDLFDDGTQYNTVEITLYKVTNGNMHTNKITEDSFFKK